MLLVFRHMPYKPRNLTDNFPIHITARTNRKALFPLQLEEAWEVFSDFLFLAHIMFGIRIHAFVMMPNHLHMIIRDPELKLPEALAHFMRETSKEIGRRSKIEGRLWGSRFHSSLINSPIYYLNAYKYVYRNPVRARLCTSPFDYPFSTLPALIGRSKTIVPIEYDDTLFSSFEESVKWLESAPSTDVETAVKLGLRRREFRPPRSEMTKKPVLLEQLEFPKR